MLNFTLTITAAPELLAALSSFTNSITNAKVVTIPESNSEYPNQTPPAQTAAVPTASQTYTMEQLAVAATQLVDAGRRTELVGLLNSFGVQALTALPREQYGVFATKLREIGAKI